ncbi:MAG TPA: iron-containing alcohol dehydrogenase [Chloroflexota bacterium]|nr:iron-containing alcohol dehydrogenase [Chloroflexota bacterium]
MDVSKFVAPEIIFGPGALGQVGESVLRRRAERLFLVTDVGVTQAGWVDRAIPYLDEQGLPWVLWKGATPNPKDLEVEQGAREYISANCDAILAIGGGSVIDAAKAIAVLVTNGGRIHDYEGIGKITRPLPPMVMVPTTAGSGADVSQFAIITDTTRRVKMVLGSKSLIPDISITDPLLLTTKDPALTAATGMDALTHAVEAYVSIAATPLTDVFALSAIRLVAKELRASVASRGNLEAKRGMAMASLQAGAAFSNAILGATHAMAHQLGGMLDLPHGVVDAILLPQVMEFNLISSVGRYADIAAALGESTANLSQPEAANRAIKAVRDLARDIGIPSGLAAVGVDEADIPALSENSMHDVCLATNPRDTGVSDIAELFRRSL